MRQGVYLMTQVDSARKAREGSFGFLLQTVARRIDANMKEQLAAIGIDVKIFANLMYLSERDGINQRQIGEMLDFPDYYTSRNVDALVNAGLAERRPDPNSRRSTLIFLTDKGRSVARKLPPVIAECNARFLEPLSESERKQVIGLLQKVARIDP